MWREVLGTVASELNTIHLILLKIVSHSVVSNSATPHQAPLSVEFSRLEW